MCRTSPCWGLAGVLTVSLGCWYGEGDCRSGVGCVPSRGGQLSVDGPLSPLCFLKVRQRLLQARLHGLWCPRPAQPHQELCSVRTSGLPRPDEPRPAVSSISVSTAQPDVSSVVAEDDLPLVCTMCSQPVAAECRAVRAASEGSFLWAGLSQQRRAAGEGAHRLERACFPRPQWDTEAAFLFARSRSHSPPALPPRAIRAGVHISVFQSSHSDTHTLVKEGEDAQSKRRFVREVEK